jgi:putative heme-binding domain-containing protein
MRFLMVVGLAAGGILCAQGTQPAPAGRGGPAPVVKNPSEGNAEAIRAGSAGFRARCAYCHGADAKGTNAGADVTGLWTAGSTDQQLFQSIRRGIPNSLKPHSFGPDNDIWAILAYLRTLDAGPSAAKTSGDASNGERIFGANCSSCHVVNGRGGRLGPELSQIGSSRSRSLLAHKVRHASSYIMSVWAAGGYIADGYQPVTLITRDGQRIRGVKKNEDAFSIQIMDTRERLQGYLKANLRELVNDDASVMPDFGTDRLSDRDLDDLLAYLGTLRAPVPGIP